MNSPDNHHPTDAFRAQLKREISRAARCDDMFGPPPSVARSRRVVNAVGVFAGVALTLLTGMVLGASASYASAAEPDAARPTFAFGPVRDALTAIGCGVTKVASHVPQRVEQPTAAVATVPDVAPETTAVVPVRADPDRAKIAALASQHQPGVTRGDSSSEYIVMILDASGRYVWSTHGNGNLSVEVGGDKRTPSERRAYNSTFAAELNGSRRQLAALPDSLFRHYAIAYDSAGGLRQRRAFAGDTSVAAMYGKVLTKRVVLDSLHFRKIRGDSFDFARGYFAMRDSALRRDVAVARVGGGGGGRGGGAMGAGVGRGGGGARGNAAFADTAATYYIGWSGTMNGPEMNQAFGLDPAGAGGGNSGITGLPSTWISIADLYRFAPGELAPQAVKVLVLQLTEGTVWRGK